jgi:hypothetical protein
VLTKRARRSCRARVLLEGMEIIDESTVISALVYFLSFVCLSLCPEGRVEFDEVKSIAQAGGERFLGVFGVTQDSRGNLLVADKLKYRICVVDRRGRILKSVGVRGEGPGQFLGPGPIDASGEIVAVADFATSRVSVYDRELRFRSTLKAPGPVSDLHFDSRGRLWLAVFTGDPARVLVRCDLSGRIGAAIPLRNTHGDPFGDIITFAFTPRDELVVAYYLSNRVEMWDTNGFCVREFRVPTLPEQPGYSEMRSSILQKGIRFPEGEIFRDVAVDRVRRIFLLTGDYSEHPDRDVIVLDSLGRYCSTMTLPYAASLMTLSKGRTAYVVDRNRLVIRQYRMLDSH